MSDFQDLITQRLEARIEAGATGTLAWADPASGVTFVLLTNGLLEPEEAGPTLQACSNIAAAALCGPR